MKTGLSYPSFLVPLLPQPAASVKFQFTQLTSPLFELRTVIPLQRIELLPVSFSRFSAENWGSMGTARKPVLKITPSSRPRLIAHGVLGGIVIALGFLQSAVKISRPFDYRKRRPVPINVWATGRPDVINWIENEYAAHSTAAR